MEKKGEETELKPVIPLISVEPEKKTRSNPRFDLKSGLSYLVEETTPNIGFEIFSDAVNNNMPGLCIIRRNPNEIRQRYKFTKTPIIWLRGTPSDLPFILSTDLGQVAVNIDEFIEHTKNGVIFLEGVEYLINNNDFRSVEQLIEHINDSISTSSCCFLLSANPKVFNEQQLSFLEREIVHRL
ncbi:MAG: DUF835 domain-containing protein [Candidatus Altiarchaeota archaeon]